MRRRGSLAAFIAEPILGSGGILELPEGYLAALQTKCRDRGLMLGMEIVQDKASKAAAPELGSRITDAAMQFGLSMNIVNLRGMGGVFRIAPPLTISDDEVDLGLSILRDVIKAATMRKAA